MTVDAVAAAKYFVGLGCTAFPVWGSRAGRCNCGDPHDGSGKFGPDNVGKHPATNNGFKDGTQDSALITRFLGNPGTPNYGLTAPPGVLVVDVDGEDGIAKWDELQHRYGPLPVTLTTLTANGRHYFYRWPEGAGPMPPGKLFGFVTRREDDGYIIGPGSVHPKGVVYDTLRRDGGHPYPIAELPESWVKAVLTSTKPDTRPDGVITIDAGGYQLPEPGYTGARYDEIVRFTASRYIRGVTKDEIWAGVENVLAPRFAVPLTEPELRSRFERAWSNTPRRLGPPMEPQVQESGEVRMVASDEPGLLPPADGEAFPDPPHPTAFAGLLGEAVEALSEGTDASPVTMLAGLLAFCGALVPARAYFHRDQTSSPYLAVVGESSVGRKGTGMFRARDALANTLGADVVNRARFDGLASGESLINSLADKQRSSYEHTAGVVMEEEYATHLAASSRDGSSLDSRMRQAFDGDDLYHRRVSGTITVTAPYWLPALIAITPTELRSKLPSGALTSGSGNRWLWLPVVRQRRTFTGTRPDLPLRIREDLMEAWRGATKQPVMLEPGPGVTEALSEYDEYLWSESVGIAADMTRRYSVIAFRIGMIHAAVERSPVVGKDHIARAVALTEYARSGLGWVFGETLGNRDATHLLRQLKEAGELTASAISRHMIRDPLRRQDAIDELVRVGLARVVKSTTSGRTRTTLQSVAGKGAFRTFSPLISPPQGPETGIDGKNGEKRSEGWVEGGEKVGVSGEKSPARTCPACHQNHPVGTVCEENP